MHKNNFYVAAFSHEKVAINLKEYLDPGVAALLDWGTLKVESGHFVDNALQNRETDLLYSIKFGDREGYIYVLLEHQSVEDWSMAFRMLEYVVRIFQHHQRQHPEARGLPVVIPIVLYQGEKTWRPSLDFADLFDLDKAQKTIFGRYLPLFAYELISLPAITDQQIKGNAYIQVVFKLMKAIRNGKMVDCLEATESLLEYILLHDQNSGFVSLCFSYALHAEGVDMGVLRDKVKVIQNPQLRETAMTVAQQLFEEGLAEGRQEGRQELLIEALEVRFSRVPDGLCEAIRAIYSAEKLKSLMGWAIRCQSLDDFAEGL